MRTIIQRVKNASVSVNGTIISKIEKGLLIFLGITHSDTIEDSGYLVNKIINLRIFEDENGKMNKSITDCGYSALVISQFTLYGDCRKGRRPSFTDAMNPQCAVKLYENFIRQIELHGINVQKGEFGAHMDVSLINDGPVTFILESNVS
ncbi:MAG: D-tyrosyl-tRNA(Tyr) deacylase [bacterium]|nr:D-tyrosyl-tRNA(Tyr) deacylase [bacterium]